MTHQDSKRVSVAIEADDGAAICGFCLNAPMARASSMFARSVARLRRGGTTSVSSIVISVEGTSEQFSSFQQAERGLARLHYEAVVRPAPQPSQVNSTH